MHTMDMEKLNRKNFKSLSDALAMPGKITQLQPVFNGFLSSIASVLLFSEVSYYYCGNEDFSVIEAIANPSIASSKEADYAFSDAINATLIHDAKKGDYLNPDFSATLIFKCEDFNYCTFCLSGPGINEKKEVNLPCDKQFIEALMEKNSDYPLGVEVFFINTIGELIALSRTTKVEVA